MREPCLPFPLSHTYRGEPEAVTDSRRKGSGRNEKGKQDRDDQRGRPRARRTSGRSAPKIRGARRVPPRMDVLVSSDGVDRDADARSLRCRTESRGRDGRHPGRLRRGGARPVSAGFRRGVATHSAGPVPDASRGLRAEGLETMRSPRRLGVAAPRSPSPMLEAPCDWRER